MVQNVHFFGSGSRQMGQDRLPTGRIRSQPNKPGNFIRKVLWSKPGNYCVVNLILLNLILVLSTYHEKVQPMLYSMLLHFIPYDFLHGHKYLLPSLQKFVVKMQHSSLFLFSVEVTANYMS